MHIYMYIVSVTINVCVYICVCMYIISVMMQPAAGKNSMNTTLHFIGKGETLGVRHQTPDSVRHQASDHWLGADVSVVLSPTSSSSP